jgi:peptidylprolyl isomerase
MRRALPLLLAVPALALGACGSDKTKTSEIPSGGTPSQSSTPAPTTPEEPKTVAEDNLKGKPKVSVPKGKAPTKLVIEDIVKGKGRAAKKGDKLTVQYVGVLFKDGTQFDASWDNGQPFDFELGGGNVIKGWDKGLVGMKVGGRRQLVIPSDLAYGAQGSPPSIPPDAALVFDIDLKKVQ